MFNFFLLPIFPSICTFLFFRAFWFYLDLVVLILFPFLISSMAYFSVQNSVLYILTVYPHFLYSYFQFFFIFGQQFKVVHADEVVDFFGDCVLLPGRYLSEFSLRLSFFLRLSITLFSFPWFSPSTWWLSWVSCTFWDRLLSSFEGPYSMPFSC